MTHIKIFITIIILFTVLHVSSHADEILKTKKWTLELGIIFAPAYVFNYPSLQNGFYFENMELKLFSEYDDRVRFIMDLDFSKLFTDEDPQAVEFIEDVYLQYYFFNALKIRVGQYKVPLGEEIFLGTAERPYLDHSFGSDKLAPGRRQGIMILGKDLFSILSYRLGIFNTSKAYEPENETPYLSAAGKLYLELNNFSNIYLKSGYSIYYSMDEIFAQSVFSFFTWQINNFHTLTLFGEYLEERFYHYYWNNSFFLMLSYRFKDFEIYCTGDVYDENSGIMDKDDCFTICSGINIYLLKNRLKAGLGHRYINEYQIGEEKNRFTVMIMWEQ